MPPFPCWDAWSTMAYPINNVQTRESTLFHSPVASTPPPPLPPRQTKVPCPRESRGRHTTIGNPSLRYALLEMNGARLVASNSSHVNNTPTPPGMRDQINIPPPHPPHPPHPPSNPTAGTNIFLRSLLAAVAFSPGAISGAMVRQAKRSSFSLPAPAVHAFQTSSAAALPWRPSS